MASSPYDNLPDKYKKLKRRYIDIEQNYDALSRELQRAAEQNRRLSQEKDMLLDRIIELQANGSSPVSPLLANHPNQSSTYPPHRRELLLRALDDSDDELIHQSTASAIADPPPPHSVNGRTNGGYARYSPEHQEPDHFLHDRIPDRQREQRLSDPQQRYLPKPEPDRALYGPEHSRYPPQPPPEHLSPTTPASASYAHTSPPASYSQAGSPGTYVPPPHVQPRRMADPSPFYNPAYDSPPAPPQAHQSPSRTRTPGLTPARFSSSSPPPLQHQPPMIPHTLPPLNPGHPHPLQLSPQQPLPPLQIPQHSSPPQIPPAVPLHQLPPSQLPALPHPPPSASSHPLPPGQHPMPPPHTGKSSPSTSPTVTRRLQSPSPGSSRGSKRTRVAASESGPSSRKRRKQPQVPSAEQRQREEIITMSNGVMISKDGSTAEIPPPSMGPRDREGLGDGKSGTPPRVAYSPAPPAPPPSGPPPRDRTSHLPPPPPPPLAPPRPRSTKPKRLKAHTVQSRSFSIPSVPRTPSGAPQLPLNVGIMTVRSLGRVCLDKHFHTERYIFPIGYEVTRRYLSMFSADAEAQYTCTILRGEDVDGGTGPRFRITPSDDVANPITAGTATGAWSIIVKTANKVRKRQHSNSVSGPDYFGLAQNTIKHLLQELEGADMLQDYVRQHFVEGGPLGGRHAAVTAAVNVNVDEKAGVAGPSGTSSSGASSASAGMEQESVGSKPVSPRLEQEHEHDEEREREGSQEELEREHHDRESSFDEREDRRPDDGLPERKDGWAERGMKM